MVTPFYLRTEQAKQEIVKDLKSLELFFKEKLDLDIYLIYGTLLGAIREHDFIPHDTDIDISYISKYNTKEGVRIERKDIKEVLKSYKMLRSPNTIGIKIKCGNNGFDMWTSWIEDDKYFILPRGNVCHSNIVLPLKKYLFRDNYFFIPNLSAILLNLLYVYWTTPLSKELSYNKKYPLDFNIKRIIR